MSGHGHGHGDVGLVYKVGVGVYPSDVRSVPLAPAEERVLRKLLEGPSSVGAAKARVVATRLVELGLVAELPRPRKTAEPRIELTEAGRREAERLPPVKVGLADLYREIRALREQVTALAQALERGDGRASVPGDGAAAAEPVTDERFDREMTGALRELDRRGRHGGLVPVPELRRALSTLGMSQAAFDRALLERERAFLIDLKVAHDRHKLPDAAEALDDPARGLLYYVVLR